MDRSASRPFVPADLGPCVDVWLRALQARDGAAPVPGTSDRIRQRLERDDHRTTVVEQDGDVVGFVTLVPDGRDGVLLQHVAVAPEAGGHGLGTRLVAAALEQAGGRRVALDVRVGNERAIAVYGRAGFVRAGGPVDHPLGGEPMVRYEHPGVPGARGS